MIFSLSPLPCVSTSSWAQGARTHSSGEEKLYNEHDDDAAELYAFSRGWDGESERRSLWLWIKFRFCSFFSFCTMWKTLLSNSSCPACVCVSTIWHRSGPVDWVARKMLKEKWQSDDDEKFSWSSSSMLAREVHVFALWRENLLRLLCVCTLECYTGASA